MSGWLSGRQTREGACGRLFCLPYAGGSASYYYSWRSYVPHDLELCPVELPGRGARFGEAPFRELPALVNALADALRDEFDLPFYLFGHSMGGVVAFELCRELRRRGWSLPGHLFVSAAPVPGGPTSSDPLHQASNERLKEQLRQLNGTPAEVIENDELMELVLPGLRADLSVLETYRSDAEPPLSIPLTILGGNRDRSVPPSMLKLWVNHSVDARMHLFRGDHFYLNSMASQVVALLIARIGAQAMV